jgi:leukotriene-A4 hydrolase
MSRPDPHSAFDDLQPRTVRWHLRLLVDFDRKVLQGEATLLFQGAEEGLLDLDTKGLAIHRAWVSATAAPVPFELGPEEPILGRRLRLTLPPGTMGVTVAYETAPDALGLQWLEPAQTEGRVHPFLFSQCQAIHARTLVPCQDSAIARVAYDAEIVVPEGLTAVMSAGPEGDGPGPLPGTRVFRFRMPQPIPSYLLALAVGELESRDLSPRARVWAEPATINQAAWEFEGVEGMIGRAESIFGPYDWDRYDMLVLPPSFPYGGMENPRMTFLTPTLLAGDRSLVDVVAHELAHSWTGNLVTNATAEHFWLNEGFTVWAERQILKALRGPEAYAFGWAIGQKALDESMDRFKDTPELTVLRTHLEGVDPDDAFSSIPYEKGARLVALLEAEVGEAPFAAFIQAYMKRFRFTSITTEMWTEFVEGQFPGVLARIGADAWLHQPGMPANAPVFRSAELEALEALGQSFPANRPADAVMAAWSPTELMVYLQNLPRTLTHGDCAWLDGKLQLTGRGNFEILVEWLTIAGGSGYEPVYPRIREVLTRVGRMKYLRPLYSALGATEGTRALARDIFAKASKGYHGLSRRVVQGVLDKYSA